MSYIESNSKIQCPDKMYKYFGNLKYALASIENDTVHFDPVEVFNDPFECYSELIYIADSQHFGLISFYILQNNLNTEDDNKQNTDLEDRIKETRNFDIYNTIMMCLKTNQSFMEQKAKDFPYGHSKHDLYLFLQTTINESEEAPLKIEKNDVINYFCEKWNLLDYKEQLIEDVSKNCSGKVGKQDQGIRVSCFSEQNDSILMWAYYANGYKGICVEYDFSDMENKKRMSRVLYKEKRTFSSKFWYRIKAHCWKHEKEWRMVQRPPIEEAKLYVKNIYFGINYDFSNDKYYDEIIQCATCKEIGLYRGIRCKGKYGIEFVPLFK